MRVIAYNHPSGRTGIAKIWASQLEASAEAQLEQLSQLPFIHEHVAAMPDCHWGNGMPIGGVIATKGVIIPACCSSDIGCGVAAVKTSLIYKDSLDRETIALIRNEIKRRIPVGVGCSRDQSVPWDGYANHPKTNFMMSNLVNAAPQLGTLGSGNHFIEIQRDENGHIWFMLHSGSRGLGYKIADHYIDLAKAANDKWYSNCPRELAFFPFDSELGHEYFDAMQFALAYARENREVMKRDILASFDANVSFEVLEDINIHHNFAAWENHFGENVIVHRKGATRARKFELGIIPGSQGTSSYIVEGLGNPESFMSCSHGAGRRMGRKEAIRTLDKGTQNKLMGDVIRDPWSIDKLGRVVLDEAPGAYKDIDQVMADQADLVKIVTKLTPIAVIKGE